MGDFKSIWRTSDIFFAGILISLWLFKFSSPNLTVRNFPWGIRNQKEMRSHEKINSDFAQRSQIFPLKFVYKILSRVIFPYIPPEVALDIFSGYFVIALHISFGNEFAEELLEETASILLSYSYKSFIQQIIYCLLTHEFHIFLHANTYLHTVY